MAVEYENLIMDKITAQFSELIAANPDVYGKYRIFISNERQFVRQKDDGPNSIYLVVSFGAAAVDFGMALLPVTIYAMSEENRINVCQRILFDYASSYTQKTDDMPEYEDDGETVKWLDTVKQIYQSPSPIDEFSEVKSGFRALFALSGSFLIGINVNDIKEMTVSYYDEAAEEYTTPEKVNLVMFATNFELQPDMQAFSRTNNLTESLNKIGTFAITFSTFSVVNSFMSRCMDIQFGEASINTDFVFRITYKSSPVDGNGDKIPREVHMKLVSMANQQNKADLPVINFNFAR